MATIVLTGLIYHICEMYIDDCIVYGSTEIEFVSRLRSIFERFRLHNLFLKASKCKFGYSELDFVGKVIYQNCKGYRLTFKNYKYKGDMIQFENNVILSHKRVKKFISINHRSRRHSR